MEKLSRQLAVFLLYRFLGLSDGDFAHDFDLFCHVTENTPNLRVAGDETKLGVLEAFLLCKPFDKQTSLAEVVARQTRE